MSRCYRISLKETISRTVSASDEMTHRVELQEGILSPEDMNNVLRESLREEGWVEGEDGKFRLKSEDGEELVWDIEEKEVSAKIEEDRSFSKEIAVTGSGHDNTSAKSSAKQQLEREKTRTDIDAEDVAKNLRKDITQKLKENEKNRRRQLNRVVGKTYNKALKKKAASLGTVVSVDEESNGGDHSLTIRVRA